MKCLLPDLTRYHYHNITQADFAVHITLICDDFGYIIETRLCKAIYHHSARLIARART